MGKSFKQAYTRKIYNDYDSKAYSHKAPKEINLSIKKSLLRKILSSLTGETQHHGNGTATNWAATTPLLRLCYTGRTKTLVLALIITGNRR